MSPHNEDSGSERAARLLSYWFSRFLTDKPNDKSSRVSVIQDLTRTIQAARFNDDYLYENAVAKRGEAFQHLIQRYVTIHPEFLTPLLTRTRYVIQLRYGCTNPNCDAIHCLSYQKRTQSTPLRPPTILTARIMASVLATLDDPRKCLCPNTPRFPPDAMRLPQFYTAGRELFPTSVFSSDPCGAEDHKAMQEAIQDYWRNSLKSRKDRRSLTQHIFDRPGMKTLESAFFKTPVELFIRLFHQKGKPVELPSDAPQSIDRKSEKFEENDGADGTRTSPSLDLRTPQFLVVNGDSPAAGPQTPPSTTITTDTLAPRKQSSQVSLDRLPLQQRPYLDEDSPSAHPQAQSVRKDAERVIETPPPQKPRDPHIQLCPSENEFRSLLSFSHEGKKMRVKLDLPVSVPLTADAMSGLRSMMRFCSTDMDIVYSQYHPYPSNTLYTNLEMKHQIRAYVKRTLFANLSSIPNLVRSFPEAGAFYDELDSQRTEKLSKILDAFTGWTPLVGPLIFDALWEALEPVFCPPVELSATRGCSNDLPQAHRDRDPYIPHSEALAVVVVSMIALIASIPHGDSMSLIYINTTRKWGSFVEAIPDGWLDPVKHPWIPLADAFEYEPAIRLMQRLVRTVGARRYHSILLGRNPSISKDPFVKELNHKHAQLMDAYWMLMTNSTEGPLRVNRDTHDFAASGELARTLFLRWLQTIVTHYWDGSIVFDRWGACGAALEMMSDLYEGQEGLDMLPSEFYLPFITARLDPKTVAAQFLESSSKKGVDNFGTLNLLNFPFIFHPDFTTGLFRTINFSRLSEAYAEATYNHMLLERLAFTQDPSKQAFIHTHLEPALSKVLILDVRRDHLLEDAFDQLWGREQRELLRPLKVRINGREGEGEEGVDHGGVSQEFFRLVWAKAFDPDAGLFTTDEKTRTSWFQPCSTEPEQTYELLGLLLGLAVYNGITLPVTFPLALYRRLLGETLGMPAMRPLPEILDGWPDILRSFNELLAWQDGDVQDALGLDYAFTFSTAGKTYTINMAEFTNLIKQNKLDITKLGDIRDCSTEGKKLASSPPPVTNANRPAFVNDYIIWLTYFSVHREITAFQSGFHKVMPDPRSSLASPLSILTTSLLRTIVEGHPDYSITDLRRISRYEDGYHASHPLIQSFWTTVSTYDANDRRKLLEFVTASDRVPAAGIDSVAFVILRAGGDSERVPSSMTCYGRLMIPEYDVSDGGKKLEGKLRVALENTVGFGHV